jgi:hypothetical protein
MSFTLKHWLLAALVGAALLGAGTPASAQYFHSGYYRPLYPSGYAGMYGNPYAGYPMVNPTTVYPTYPAMQPAYSPAASNPALYNSNPYLSPGSTATLTTTPTSTSPVTQYGDPYLSPYTSNPYASYYNPWGGYLSGRADLVTARANAAVTYQRAGLVQEEVFRSQLDTRRKIWEEARYERATLLNSEQLRLTEKQNALDRARHDPPAGEIVSGQSLNDLFSYLNAQQGKGFTGQPVTLGEDVLKHINVTTDKGGNAGLLKSDIKWPAPLQRSEFEDTRKKLEQDLTEAVRQAKFGPVDQNKVVDIKNNIQKMQDILLSRVNDMQPADYMTAKKYLNMLDDSARALSDPNVQNFFNDKWSAKGKTVGDLVKYMSRDQGLKFAPATPGDEWAYRALWYAMRDYDASIMQQVYSTPSRP